MEMLINRTTMEEKKARARRNTRIFRCLAGAALAACLFNFEEIQRIKTT